MMARAAPLVCKNAKVWWFGMWASAVGPTVQHIGPLGRAVLLVSRGTRARAPRRAPRRRGMTDIMATDRTGFTIALLGLLSLTLAGCGLVPGLGGPSVCATGNVWDLGDQGSPLMHPGDDCIACHANKGGDAPKLLIAGTVMGGLKDETDCGGIEGVTVQVTEKDGHVIEMQTNKAGNFLLKASDRELALPFTVKLIYNGREREMKTPQSNGACATCHTPEGENGAPGRILVPE